MAEEFHIGVAYSDQIPSTMVEEFAAVIQQGGLVLKSEPRPNSVYAALEWTLPTLVIVYLSKPYFESFLKEAGKDHYQLLKAGISGLFKKLFGEAPEKRIRKYSLLFSIVIKTQQGGSAKFVFPEGVAHEEYDNMVHEAISTCASYYHFSEDEKLKPESRSSNLYLTWSVEKSCWEPLDEKSEIEAKMNSDDKT